MKNSAHWPQPELVSPAFGTIGHGRLLLAGEFYYAFFSEEPLSPVFPDGLKSVEVFENSTYRSSDADLDIRVDLGDRHPFKAIFSVSESRACGTALRSKSSNSFTSRNTRRDSTFDPTLLVTTGFAGYGIVGVGQLFLPGAKDSQSNRDAVHEAFETRPSHRVLAVNDPVWRQTFGLPVGLASYPDTGIIPDIENKYGWGQLPQDWGLSVTTKAMQTQAMSKLLSCKRCRSSIYNEFVTTG